MKQKAGVSSPNFIILFPRIYRFITETTFSKKQEKDIKVLLTSAVSLFFIMLIALQSVILLQQLKQQQYLSQERVRLQQDIQYWQGVADKYKGYRDVYYRIASLQYRLGNVAESQKYIKKALELDPNFPEGSVLGAKIGIQN